MALFENKYSIECARYPNWDYRNAHGYFITICTKDQMKYLEKLSEPGFFR